MKSILLAGALLLATPVFFSACQEDAPEIDYEMKVTVVNDFTKVVEAINNGALKNEQAINQLKQAIDQMNADQQTKLQAIIDAVNAVNNTLDAKLAVIEAAIKAQTLSMEAKMDLLKGVIAAQTKGFCGVTVAKLVEEGRLKLDDPVYKYLPEFGTLWILESENDSTRVLRKAKNPLTIRMCLNHTGGFPFECSAKRSDVRGGGWSGGGPLRQIASVAAESPILFEPGTDIKYSNTGIDIAAAVVEVVTGMKWEDYLRQSVLEPLGMKSTWFWPSDRQLENQIEMYKVFEDGPCERVEENSWQQRPYNDGHVFASAGAGLWSTAEDHLKFYKMLMNLGLGDNGVRILEEETVKSLLAVSSPLDSTQI